MFPVNVPNATDPNALHTMQETFIKVHKPLHSTGEEQLS